MRSPAGPFALLVVVAAATFGVAKWHPFSPAAPAAPVSGDPVRGKAVFARNCAGCHGADATGGVGPSLVDAGLTASQVEATVATGRGVMPPALVTGRPAADVAAYVATLSQ